MFTFLEYNVCMNKWIKITLRIVIVLALGVLFKLAPRPYRVTQDFRDAQTALGEEDFRAVAEHLAAVAEHLPWRDELWESAGNYALRAGDYELAQLSFEEAEEREALTPAGQLALGDVYHALGEDALAGEVWGGIEGSSGAWRRLGLLHREMGDIPATITDLQALLALGPIPDEVDIHYQLGLLLAAHDPSQAISHLEAAASLYPAAQILQQTLAEIPADTEPAYFYTVSGQALASLGEWFLAEHAFQQAVTLRGDYAEAWAYLGEAQQHVEGDDKEPLLALEKALTLDPVALSANMFLGLYWQRQGEYQEALGYFEAVAELRPDLPEVYVEQARTLAALGELSDAETMYRTAIARANQDVKYYHLLAQFCVQYHYKVREVGLPAARQALWMGGETPASLDALGLVLFELEDEFNAERLLLHALETYPHYALAHLHLGIVYLSQEDNTRAYHHLKQALNFASDPAVIEQAQHLLSYFTP